MAKERRLLKFSISAVTFILLEVAALAMLNRSGDLQHMWIARTGYRIRTAAWSSSETIRSYFMLQGANEKLAAENIALNNELLHLRNRIRVNKADSISTYVPVSDGFRKIPAMVCKISRNSQHSYIILDKGSEDGVIPQSGIVTSDGVVGIIDAVDRHFSYGISFMNTNMSVSARIGSEGAVGPLSWDGVSSRGAVLKQIPLQYRYSPGDTIWTSGHSQLYPADIPLGIAGESKVVNGSVNEISVKLFEDFNALRYVTIVCAEYVDEIGYLENLEEHHE